MTKRKRYCVTIREDLARSYWVDATDEDDARAFIEALYNSGKIALDVGDYCDGSSAIESEESDWDVEPDYVLDEHGKEVCNDAREA